jgi:Alr-MurF fusion protein
MRRSNAKRFPAQDTTLWGMDVVPETPASPTPAAAPGAGAAAPGAAFWPLTAAEVAGLTGGALAGDPEARCERVLTDSRAAVRAGDLFIGLAGPHFDGGAFAAQALEGGAAAALVAAEGAAQPAGTGRAVIAVADPLAALHALAAEARRRFSGLVVGVTGSNGKTLVKDMLAAALGGSRRVAASPLSYNSQVGVALSLLGFDPAAAVAVVECGISLPGEMDLLEAMVRPDRGILTTIGDAHLEGLGSRRTTAREKARLFHRLPAGGWVLVPAGEEGGRAALAAVGAPQRTVGGEGADFILERRGAEAVLRWGEAAVPLIPGEASLGEAPPHLFDCAALAAAAALLLGAEPAAVAEGLARWQPAPMRLELATTPRGVLLINDAYSADPVSVEAALATLCRERGGGAAIAVLGGMAQLGVAREAAHARVGRRVVELGIDRLVGVGPGGGEIAAAAVAAGMDPGRVDTVGGVEEAAAILEEHCRPGDRVLLKASRPERLERVASLLFDSVASARLFVDLDRLLANFRAVRRAAGRERGVMAVVKSFGYGLDAVRVSKVLERAGVDYLAVAYPDEGVLLRDHGVTTPVLVQNVLEHEADKVARYGLTAQVSSAAQAGWVAAEAERQRRAVKVHLKLDTGMGRAGAFASEAVALAAAVASHEWLVLEGLATHFAAADDPAHDDFTRGQVRRFDAAREALARAGIALRWVHAANSAAIARFPEAHYTMVRTGLALLGYSRVAARVPLPQEPVLRLTTQVVSVKELPPGHAVGYGLTYGVGENPRTIAIVALGYSDGYPWALSNQGWMLAGGHRCPVVGSVCMDVTLLDVSDVPGGVRPGDEVVVFGPDPEEPQLPDLARLANTIPYELLTRISHRVRRIYRTSH